MAPYKNIEGEGVESISDCCRRTGEQNCIECNDLSCVDNLSAAVYLLRTAEAERDAANDAMIAKDATAIVMQQRTDDAEASLEAVVADCATAGLTSDAIAAATTRIGDNPKVKLP